MSSACVRHTPKSARLRSQISTLLQAGVKGRVVRYRYPPAGLVTAGVVVVFAVEDAGL